MPFQLRILLFFHFLCMSGPPCSYSVIILYILLRYPMLAFLESFNTFLWSGPVLLLLSGTHLLFTLRLHFPQRLTFRAIRLSVTPEDASGSEKGLSGFATLATTLAATLGTGNIVGVSTAIALGGPGALFWCWVTGIFGMATSYAECYLSGLYKKSAPTVPLWADPCTCWSMDWERSHWQWSMPSVPSLPLLEWGALPRQMPLPRLRPPAGISPISWASRQLPLQELW